MRARFHLLSNEARRESADRRANGDQAPAGSSSDLTTGAPNLTDLPAICTAFRIQVDLARPHRSAPWLAERVLREQIGPLRGDIRLRVARRSRRHAATAAFRVIEPDGRWHLEALMARDPDDGAAIDAVLRRSVSDAGAGGARRVFARLPGDDTIDGALRRSGFVPFMHESVFMLVDEAGPRLEAAASHVRRVHPADVWGIHQLYLEVVPRQIQYAEAVTSRVWERSRALRPGSRRSSGWVIEDGGRIRGYARVSTEEDPGVVRIDLLIDPDLRALATDLIAAATAEARNLHGVPCVTAVPGYSQELSQPLQDAGFFHTGDQTAWVCYTTVPARSYIVAVELGSPVAVEAQRSRAPGFGGAGMSRVEYSGRNGARSQDVPTLHEARG
jgi:hypothetical protein